MMLKHLVNENLPVTLGGSRVCAMQALTASHLFFQRPMDVDTRATESADQTVRTIDPDCNAIRLNGTGFETGFAFCHNITTISTHVRAA